MNESSPSVNPNNELVVSDPAKQNRDNSIWKFVVSLVKLWWLFLIIGAIAGVLGIYYASRQKVNYESNLTFVLQPGTNSSGVSGALSLAAQFGLNIGGGDDVFSGDNILEIIKSRRIVESVFLSTDTFDNKPLRLIEFYLQESSKPAKDKDEKSVIHFPVDQARNSFTYAQDSVLYEAYRDFVASSIVAERPDKALSIFSIKVTSGHEKFSKIFTDRLIKSTDSFYTEICSKKERETLEILEQRVASMRGNLSASISSRAATQDANVNPAFAAAQVPLQKQQANIQVYGGAYAEMFKNLELARYQYLQKIPLIQIIDSPAYPMKKVKAGKLKTGIIFAFTALFLTTFILWLRRLYKISS